MTGRGGSAPIMIQSIRLNEFHVPMMPILLLLAQMLNFRHGAYGRMCPV